MTTTYWVDGNTIDPDDFDSIADVLEHLVSLGALGRGANKAVQAAATWLDAWAPRDWAKRIDTSTLDLSDSSQCVLGQIFNLAPAPGYGYGGNPVYEVLEREARDAIGEAHKAFFRDDYRNDWIQAIEERLED